MIKMFDSTAKRVRKVDHANRQRSHRSMLYLQIKYFKPPGNKGGRHPMGGANPRYGDLPGETKLGPPVESPGGKTSHVMYLDDQNTTTAGYPAAAVAVFLARRKRFAAVALRKFPLAPHLAGGRTGGQGELPVP